MAKYPIDKSGKVVVDKRINGKRIHFRADTVREADRRLAQLIAEQAIAEKEKELSPLFEEVAEKWWLSAGKSVKVGTMRCYQGRYSAAVERFHGERMKDITTAEITAFLGRMAFRGFSKKTIQNQKTVLSNIFNYWIQSEDWEGDRNPALDADIPKRAKSERREPPTEEQLKAVKSHPEGFGGFVAHLFMYTGIRLGEANGIQIQDITLFPEPNGKLYGMISINKAYPWQGNTPYLETTKTEQNRDVPIFEPLYFLLIERLRGKKKTDFLLSGCDKPLTKSVYERGWTNYCREIGFAEPWKKQCKVNLKLITRTEWRPLMTAHQFRHEFATACYDAGVDILTAAAILGHADVKTTQSIYTHIREQKLKQSYGDIAEVFTKQSPKTG